MNGEAFVALSEALNPFFLELIYLLVFLLHVVAVGHAVLYRRDARTTIAWVGVIWLVPVAGPLLYLALGINRIRRKAQRLRSGFSLREGSHTGEFPRSVIPEYHAPLAQLVGKITKQPLLEGNHVKILNGGKVCYDEMIDAINNAENSVSLMTYIFDYDRAGKLFVDALAGATSRGVEVRVLVDGAGIHTSRPRIHRVLERRGVRVARFMPTWAPWLLVYLNLRNHRKTMVVDGRIGFTGGMNIREGVILELKPPPTYPFQDVHARFDGAVVNHIQTVFVEDWRFATGEILNGPKWFPRLKSEHGSVAARGIIDGPDEDFEHLKLTVLGALTVAKRAVRIVTPYFIPDTTIVNALNVAALRGVDVQIVIPEKGNIRSVQWASDAMLWQVLERGCRVWRSPPPFDHSKLMVVDESWILLGSGNWDPRSLRLNFEFNVECYNDTLGKTVTKIIDEKISRSRLITLKEMDNRAFPIRIRDGFARLLSPYL